MFWNSAGMFMWRSMNVGTPRRRLILKGEILGRWEGNARKAEQRVTDLMSSFPASPDRIFSIHIARSHQKMHGRKILWPHMKVCPPPMDLPPQTDPPLTTAVDDQCWWAKNVLCTTYPVLVPRRTRWLLLGQISRPTCRLLDLFVIEEWFWLLCLSFVW